MSEREKRLLGKTAFITGAGSGLGRAIALRYAREGANVAINDLNEESAKNTAEEVKALGVQSLVLGGDVTNSERVQEMAKEFFEAFPQLDILVNNAGVGASASSIMMMKEEVWERIIRINLWGPFLVTKYFGKKMKRAKVPPDQLRGKIINMSSMRGLAGRALFGAYCVSKAGVVSFTQSLADELGKSRITVNALCPGLIHTPMYGNISKENLAGNSPVTLKYKPVGVPDDVAGVAFFLASPDSDWITGQCFPVSGGQFFH